MPQLMPLMWYYSMFMSFLLVFMLIEMYFYSEMMIYSKDLESLSNFMFFKW